jgi:PAS domain S-box-containing protein
MFGVNRSFRWVGWLRRSVTLLSCLLLGTQAISPQSPSGSVAPPREVRRVLIFNELGLWSPGVYAIDKEIFSALRNSPYQVEFYSEDLDTSLFPDEATQQRFHEWYFRKYQDRKPDLIVAVGPSAIKFMAESHKVFSPNTPIIFWSSTDESAELPRIDGAFTGVFGVAQPEKTLAAALRLQPDTEHVVVVGGVAPYDRHLETLVKQSFGKYEAQLDFIYLTDLPMPQLLERLKHLPSHSIVYHTSIMQDSAGTHFVDAVQSVPMVASAAKAPVFAVDDVDVGSGTVGGDVFSFSLAGRVLAEMASKILNGEKPENIPIVRGANIFIFDWRALNRWGLKESNLPPGSIVLNRQPSVWESYKWYIIGGICLVLIQSSLILGLLFQRSRAKKAESELTIAYDRLRMAVEASKSVGWDLDVKTGRDSWFGDLQTMFGVPSGTFVGTMADFRRRVHPDDRDLVSNAFADAQLNRKPYVSEFRVVRVDQTVRWITAHGKFYYDSNGAAYRMLGMATDVTDAMLMEQQVRESEERFRLVANTAPVMIWMSGPDKLCTYFNQQWLEFTGRPLQSELGDGWAEGVHPDDRDRCLKTYLQAFDRGERFKMQYRIKRHDGEYRWILDFGVPRMNPKGSCIGYIGSCMDITDSKVAEEALSNIGRRLIQAHEEERAWIGRELHDDITQQIALVAVDLERCTQDHPESGTEIQNRISAAAQRLMDLSKDVQALSHRLHPSKVEYLGIVGAAKSLCRDLVQQHKVEIVFRHEGMPSGLSKEISLCLFRVLQESLQNALKYSGVRSFQAELRGTPASIQLIVSDLGAGFDVQDAIRRQGIGLVSMRERVQLVGGELSISSQPGHGTTVNACVPLKVEERSLSTAV